MLPVISIHPATFNADPPGKYHI